MSLSISLTPGYTFQKDELCTIDKLNLLSRPAILLEGSISSIALASEAVTTDKLCRHPPALANSSLGRACMDDGYLSADAEGRAKMADGFLTGAKFEQGSMLGVPQYSVGLLTGATYAVTLVPAITSLAAGMVVRFNPNANCPAGGVTLNVNATGAIAIFREISFPPNAGDIKQNQICEVIYDGAHWQLFSPRTSWFASTLQTIPGAGLNGTLLTATAHGLGATPIEMRAVIVCTNAGGDGGYALNDEVDCRSLASGAWFSWWASLTQVGAAKNGSAYPGGGTAGAAQILNKSGILQDISLAANWKFKLYARGYS